MSSQEDRFHSPRPKFIPSGNNLLIPKDQDHHTPSPSLISRAENEGKVDIAELIKHAQEEARSMAKVQEKITRIKKNRVEDQEAEVFPVSEREIDPSLILTDEEFIKRTRGRSILDPDVKALFFANGGAKHLIGSIVYGVAFENLRREKLNRLRGNSSREPYKRVYQAPTGTRSYVAGLPDAYAKERKNQEAKMRNSNSCFGFVAPNKSK